jgi:holo-[acyl-carrier protein] synthase
VIAGIGVDVVDLARFERAIARTPRLVERLFAESERGRHPRSLAARFAAKEALIKALGGPGGLRWHDMVIDSNEHGDPEFRLSGTVQAAARAQSIVRVHVSMSHDAGVATAFVVTERASA